MPSLVAGFNKVCTHQGKTIYTLIDLQAFERFYIASCYRFDFETHADNVRQSVGGVVRNRDSRKFMLAKISRYTVIVWYVKFSGKKTKLISQKLRDASKNAFNMPSKMLQIVYLRCSSTLPVVCRNEIWVERPAVNRGHL